MTNKIRNPHLPEGCCIPFRRAWPSGISWTHDRRCEVAPNQKFSREQALELKTHSREHMYARFFAKRDNKPLGIHEECLEAARQGEVVCSNCSPRIAATAYDLDHSDDHDDREVEIDGR